MPGASIRSALGYPVKPASYARLSEYHERPVASDYPSGRTTSPVFRPASFSFSRATTPRLVATKTAISPLTSSGSSLDESPQLRPQPDARTFSLSRITSGGALREPCGDSTDDSERVVERLIDTNSIAMASSSATPPSPPVAETPESPPGYAWKRTVLIPTDRTLRLPTNISFPIPTWQYDPHRRQSTSSSRPPFAPSLSSAFALPVHHPLSLRPSTPPIVAPVPRSPVKMNYAAWDSSDTDSP